MLFAPLSQQRRCRLPGIPLRSAFGGSIRLQASPVSEADSSLSPKGSFGTLPQRQGRYMALPKRAMQPGS
jgi:hypothetical protein